MRARVFAIPHDHGAWALWLGPFLAGWGVAGRSSWPLLWTFLAVLSLFLARHPMIILVRSLSGRRKREDAPHAARWMGGYLAAALLFATLLVSSGYARLLLLALPALPLLAWQLVLVARKQERQMPVELLGSVILALAAPAAYLTAGGGWGITALMLWALTSAYAVVSVVYVHLRLDQRRLDETPPVSQRLLMGRPAMRTAAAALVLSALGVAAGWLPRFTPIPFIALQLQVIWGTLRPAVDADPRRLGWSQVLTTVLFVALLVAAYRM